MKKLTLILAALVLFAGVSFAQTTPAPAKAKTEKKAKKVKKDHAKKSGKKAAAATPAAK